ncbi:MULTISPECIES: hypothetical protein [unclassified Pseudomonas]|uniref:hypothetical protein n=1 Tax=unclassified Pseudomonas TaxID=196821 RepID=UPI000C889D36|nr:MULTISPECIES: hypothetical protein [unclassified Pseudomonas]PMX29256.1 hypothetical protein C1Y23_01530 [Pseudomonas sp. GW460-12]PMX36887.1 hypothetical protein C1Y24_04390 [Pseudomonas sp. MPR-R2A4]PMX43283.1 hypothetical protein C1Y26_03260 [Pseudomonas sp. MPR-R2A7]PMX53316.1 hypothetical protein C1Y17_14225 [Pseudomonas sp. MPR-R2A6]PMX93408.1 hypothetical protein C1Y21_02805 [Pseudomonas sp. MPR-R2A3]
MNSVINAIPRKVLQPFERDLLRAGNRMLLEETNGRIGSAALMDLVTDWLAHRSAMGFEQFAKAWITQGGAKNKIAERLLRQMFGMDEPDPRRAA